MISKQFVLWFEELTIKDVPRVGGKNAALGEMYQKLNPMGVNVPGGFALTAEAYRYFLEATGLDARIKKTLSDLDTRNLKNLQVRGKKVREMILKEEFPEDLHNAILEAYEKMCKRYGKDTDVAVRSSATAEDLPGASFAGQQETYLNVKGAKEILLSARRCISSLFTDRAISYRADKGFSHMDAALSVGVQKMVRSDLASSGVMFTLDTETGFEEVVVVSGSYGLGEMIVQGRVVPDEFVIFKPGLKEGRPAIISRELGRKNRKIVYAAKGIVEKAVPAAEVDRFCLTDKEVLTLAKWGVKIEDHFSKVHGHHQPMDIEWAKDGKTGELFIVQARPETIHTGSDRNVYREYVLKKPGETILSGIAVGTKIGSGKVRVIPDTKHIGQFRPGEVLVTRITDPDWEPIMKIASAIVTEEGGRTSHAAIVSRELGIPCIVGTGRALSVLKTGMPVTVDCSSGKSGNVLRGALPFEVLEHRLDKLPKTRTKVMVNVGSPEEAFKNHKLPAQGVGLGRLEFIIAEGIQIHPNALIDYERLKGSRDPKVRALVKKIEERTRGYKDKKEYYVDKLASGIAKIGAAFWPHEVIIRFSDFKTNEYRKLTGGELYEPAEENPMLGWRGASRYYHPRFREAFGLECQAMERVRGDFGLTNVVGMVPFCRTPKEGEQVLEVMKENGLSRERDKTWKIYVMCEIPSNILRAEEFLEIFDGMSIGSNDLSQLTLGIDRDSSTVSGISNENDPAVKKLIAEIIRTCLAKKKYIGICGQAPSDYPEFAAFLVSLGIESISLNADTVVKTLERIADEERKN